jgi:hypothetical protein
MNIEQTKEAIKVMQAFVDGKEVEHWYYEMWVKIHVPRWDWGNTEYRIKPTPTFRPWTADEVPLGVWMRLKNLNETRSMIVSVAALNLETVFKGYEHSTDGGKTWKPCGVEESQ